MKRSVYLQRFAAMCIGATASTVFGQTNAYQLFSPVDVRQSTQNTGYGSANTFNSTILDLTCTQPISAVISSSPDGTGKVLVDNFISFSTGGTAVNICTGGGSDLNGAQQDCFAGDYAGQALSGALTGQNPDTFVSSDGVPPLDVSNLLSAGPVQAQIGLVDTGGYLTSTTLYLVTSCTSKGVAGPGRVTGNPIPQNNATPQQLAQNAPFNSTTNQQVQFTYDLTAAENAGTLTIQNGTTPVTTDTPLNPGNFPSIYLSGTSFSTANCLLHTGELYSGSPACKLYNLSCQVGTTDTQSGILCPTSYERNEVFQEQFDGPAFSLPDITANGITFHQGVGLLEAKDKWGGGSCIFDQSSSLKDALCPQNVLTIFTGPGLYKSGGSGQSPNSTFISVAPVPEALTTIVVTGQLANHWINSSTAAIHFTSTPPSVPSSLPGSSGFIPAPIQSLTYGISGVSSVPSPPAPIAGDITVTNPTSCPAPESSTPPATVFTPATQTLTLADGQYLLHYYAQDCAGTQELQFTQPGGSWATSFYTFPIYVDTTAPSISGPTLPAPPSAAGYTVGEKVKATYSCGDGGSGIVTCGMSTYSPAVANTGTLSSYIDTSKAGKQTFTVNAVDAAGNKTSASVGYTVVSANPVNLQIFKTAPFTAKHGSQITYKLTLVDISAQAASAVTITDALPAGVSYVSAKAEQAGNAASCSFASNTVSCTTPSLGFLTPAFVQIVVQVTASNGTKIKNTATVTSANPAGPLTIGAWSATTTVQ